MTSLEKITEQAKEISRLINAVYDETEMPFSEDIEEFMNVIRVSVERMLLMLQEYSLVAQKEDKDERIIERGLMVDMFSPIHVIIAASGLLLETDSEKQQLGLSESQKQFIQSINDISWQISLYFETLRRKLYGPHPENRNNPA